MRNTRHMKNHLTCETWVNGEKTDSVGIEDPFVTTRCVIVTDFSWWDRLKILFSGQWTTRVRFHIHGDTVAHKRWFAGQDGCDRCGATIGFPHDGSNADDPGYHHGDDRLCETCYYGYPQPKPESQGMCATEAES